MKKLITALLVFMMAGLYSAEWYSNRGEITDEILKAQRSTKDSTWYSYCAAYSLYWTFSAEKAVYVNANDFGLEYPVRLHSIDSFLYEPNYPYTYKVYSKDGTDLLWEMAAPGTSTEDYFNVHNFEVPMIMKDDFWISVTPLDGGHPALITTDVVTSDHSYYKADGSWTPMYEETERYEWAIDFALSPYTGEDTYPPSLREVTEGTANFFGVDAELVMMIQDQSAVVTPTTGQYSVDGGTIWTDFTVTYISDAVKGSYLFGGTVPGQPDGTTALVHIYLEDALGNSATTDDFEVTWSRSVPLVFESFENDFPPEGWTNTPGPGCVGFEKGLLANGVQVHTGGASLLHFYMEDGSTFEDDWIYTSEFTLPSDGMCALSFWQSGNWITVYEIPECQALHEVAISTDGGTTWNQLFEGPPTADPADEWGDLGMWTEVAVGLKEYAGQTAIIGFHYQGVYSTEWYVDDVALLYDGDAPVITDVAANESLYPDLHEYFNNDMVISVTFEDLVGLADCTGHYSFDGGTNVYDVVFSKAKGTEIWSGTVPARNDEIPGTIYFTYTDLGGTAGTSADYNIKFIPDTNIPVVKDFAYGAPVFLDQDMTIILTFTDESAISSLTGWYSEDDWVTQTEVVMTPSKDHTYIYSAVLPAKSAVTFAKVKFDIADAAGNSMSSKIYTVKWLDGEDVLVDDFESDSGFWDWSTPATTWTLTDEESVSGAQSLTDSYGGNYPDKKKNRLMSLPQDFSAYMAATAFLWAKIDIEPDWEFFMLQGTTSTDAVPADTEWITLLELCDYQQPWRYYEVNLGSLAGQANVRLRVKIDSDTAVNADGAYIDDLRIVGYFDDFSPPQMVYGGPEIIVGGEYTIPREFTIPVGMGDYTFNVEATDISDISEIKVVYSVDGGPEQEALPAVSSGPSGTYEMAIPEQAAGSQVYYRIVATDNSTWKNSGETKTYMIRFGNFLYYQNGDDYTDFLDIIGNGPGASAQAIAKRVTMGPMDAAKGHYRSNLVGITIDNYINIEDGYYSDPMYIHVWANDNGAPGEDLIEPFYFEQAATQESSYEITYVDLRAYSAVLSNIEGDVFVGFTSAGSETCLLYEVVSSHIGVPGYVAFERSWLGYDNNADGVLDSWEFDPASVYHISAVIDVYEYIDGPLAPTGFALANEDYDDVANLIWNASPESEFVDHYNVYRDETPDFALVTPLASVSADSALVYDDGVLTVGVTYYYKLTAVDTLGFESSPSVELEYNCTSGINENIPLTTELFQNYPNPFNPETSIKFTLATNSDVSLTVYNTKGEKVVGLMDGKLKAGYYNTSFNASKLVSGVYYYTLKVDSKAMTKKMMLIK